MKRLQYSLEILGGLNHRRPKREMTENNLWKWNVRERGSCLRAVLCFIITKMRFTRVCMGTLRVCFNYLKSNVLWIKLTYLAFLSYSFSSGVLKRFQRVSAGRVLWNKKWEIRSEKLRSEKLTEFLHWSELGIIRNRENYIIRHVDNNGGSRSLCCCFTKTLQQLKTTVIIEHFWGLLSHWFHLFWVILGGYPKFLKIQKFKMAEIRELFGY